VFQSETNSKKLF